MGSPDPLKQDVGLLISHNFGEDVGKFFSNAYEEDATPVFLHHSFIILKELMGEVKAREQLNIILHKHGVEQKYE